MRHKLKKSLLLIVVIVMLVTCTNISTLAAFQVEIISDLQTTLVAGIPNYTFDNVTYAAVGGFAIGESKNSMFSLKASSNEQMALFYYFPEIDEPDRFGVYRLRHAGHANAMAIDSSNIYVTGWVYNEDNVQVGNQANNTYNNWILKIPRSTIASMGLTKTGQQIPKDDYDTDEVEGFSVLYPKVKTVNADGSITYSDYDKTIMRISKYKSNGTFIINYTLPGVTGDFVFTKARLETYQNKTYFVVSEAAEDIFIVANTMQHQSTVGQDIFYSEDNGLFIPRWYGGGGETYQYYNPAKNVISWANIDGTYTPVSINGTVYKKYTPAKINVNMGVSSYEKFEIESLAFDQNDDMLFSANVKQVGASSQSDSIYRLTRTNGTKFTIS